MRLDRSWFTHAMALLTDATVLTRRPTVIGTEVGGTVVLLDEHDGFLELNPVGAEIWEIIAQPTPVSALILALTHTFGVDEPTVRRDVLPFIDTLVDKGLASAQ